jgi:hypothetical protein
MKLSQFMRRRVATKSVLNTAPSILIYVEKISYQSLASTGLLKPPCKILMPFLSQLILESGNAI